MTKRTHGPCTCGGVEANESCAPWCPALYPAQQDPDALTKLCRLVRQRWTTDADDRPITDVLDLISEAREEQRKHGATLARLDVAEDTIRNLRSEVDRLRNRLDRGEP